jgi:DNA-binding NarL/FixJ family response regulator
LLPLDSPTGDHVTVHTSKRPIRVLIVDDQEPFRAALRMVVELMDDFEVAGEAHDGESGLTLADELVPDLVLMDVQMPGIDGIEATRRLTAAHGDIRVIVLSTYHAREYGSSAIEAGAVAFISKAEFGPASLAALAQTWAE